MSRIIVKNLPKKVTEKHLKDVFSTKGDITDLQLKYTKSGVFRRFAFIGYKTEEEAEAAKNHFNNTFIYSSKIQVEICTNLFDPNRPKPWKEFTDKMKNIVKEDAQEKIKKEQVKKKTNKDSIPDELKSDSQFKEFMEIHKDRKSKPIWSDAVGELQYDHSDSDASKSGDDGYDTAPKDELYSDNSPVESKAKKVTNSKQDSTALSKTLKTSSESDIQKQVKKTDDSCTVKMRNLPFTCKKGEIRQFFHPLKIVSLRLPPKGKGMKGFAYVKFSSEKDMNKAISKNKGFLGGRQVDVVKYIRKETVAPSKSYEEVAEEKEKNKELLAETGRIYARNLCHSVTENDIENLFSKYGPLAEVHLPMDLFAKRPLGFAFISYVFAEHAVKAFTELDGTIFQGRVLHLIPAKPKKEFKVDENETNYKKKKEALLKSMSGSSHNWNILFLGMNAVADVIAEKYNVQKSKLLSGDSRESVAVRMALAETQVVMETRKFLIDNGVELDAFSQAAAERSKTVIVVKHLPAKTSSEELFDLFSKYGKVSRVILPPSGMVALIEFQEPAEAKEAFKKLAYSRFHHLPLYLEWAPMNAVKEPPEPAPQSNDTKPEELPIPQPSNLEEDVEEPPPSGTTIFVKNLNFSTTQEDFKKHFQRCGPIHYAAISMKTDIKTGKLLSMGFGFVQYKKQSSAAKAVQNLQLSKLDGHSLELKFATRATIPKSCSQRKKYEVKKQLTSKILVRNVPFEASEKEIKDLFKEFGTLKFVRLPKKLGLSGEHRGFGFVEYMTNSDAKRAFDALCHSTHLFGRRLVLEWANPESLDINELRKKTAKDFVEGGRKPKLKKSKLMDDVALASALSMPEE